MDHVNLSEIIYNDLEKNEYLHDLYSKLLKNYAKKYLKLRGSDDLSPNLIDALRFADILSKSIHPHKSDIHKNIAQELIVLTNKMYPENLIAEYVMGSVLTNVSNFRGLSVSSSQKFESSDILENLYYSTLKKILKIPETDYYFIKDQKIIYDNFKNDYYSYSGPTSMGKSFVIRMFIKNKVKSGYKGNFVLVVPTKALINEISSKLILDLNTSLKENNYHVITSPGSLLLKKNNNFILVLTPERLLHLLLTEDDFQINYLFIDEAHKISAHNQRSAFYYKIIGLVAQNKNTHIFFSAPYVPNPQIYLDLIPKNDNIKKTDNFNYSPVSQLKFLIDIPENKVKIYNNLTEKFLKDLELDCVDFIDFIKRFKSNQNIVYCNSTEMAIKNAILYASKLPVINDNQLNELIKEIKRSIHNDYYLVKILSKGVAYHVGYLPAEIRLVIERLFREGIINTIFCTSTLLEGVNFPADNLFITSYKIGRSNFKSIDFKNLIGRAGRIEYNLYGNVFFVSENPDSKDKFEKLLINDITEQKVSIELSKPQKQKIITSLSNGSVEFTKPKTQTFEDYSSMRKYSLILLKDILNENKNSYLYSQFSSVLTETEVTKIKEAFSNIPIDDNINISIDQTENLVQSINDGLTYPKDITYDEVYSFLEKLKQIFKWNIYESDNLGRGNSIKWYAVILTKWMLGDGLHRIIQGAIDYKKDGMLGDGLHRISKESLNSNQESLNHKKENKFSTLLINGEIVEYNNSIKHKNFVINDILETIDKIILFKFTSYFMKFSTEFKKIHNLDFIENDWYEYVEYGTNKTLSIFLQKSGLSRETSSFIKDMKVEYVIEKNNTYYLRKKILSNGNANIKKEIDELYYNFPGAFIDD